jgi:hypothetical protein
MTARLVLSLDNRNLSEYSMDKERYAIGRSADNDIRIDSNAISGHHALVINILNDSFLEDLNSTNGTYVNGKLIKKHALLHGDVITLGHHQLRFIGNEPAQDELDKLLKASPPRRPDSFNRVAPPLAGAASDATTPAPSYYSSDLLPAAPYYPSSLSPEISSDAPTDIPLDDLPDISPSPRKISRQRTPPSNAQPPKARLLILSGTLAGRELELDKPLTTLGRPGTQMAAITRRQDGFYISHPESGQRGDSLLLNGSPVGAQATRLCHNDIIQLSGVKMGFFKI